MPNWGGIIGAGLAGLGSYFDYKDKKKRQKELDKEYSAYRYAQMQAQMQSGGGGGRSSGGGAASVDPMRNLLLEYYKKASDLRQPYIDVGKEVLPAQSAAYQKGLVGAGDFVGQALDPEFLRRTLAYNRPDGPPLPEYLRGGKK